MLVVQNDHALVVLALLCMDGLARRVRIIGSCK